jgi:hypothetical protein
MATTTCTSLLGIIEGTLSSLSSNEGFGTGLVQGFVMDWATEGPEPLYKKMQLCMTGKDGRGEKEVHLFKINNLIDLWWTPAFQLIKLNMRSNDAPDSTEYLLRLIWKVSYRGIIQSTSNPWKCKMYWILIPISCYGLQCCGLLLSRRK